MFHFPQLALDLRERLLGHSQFGRIHGNVAAGDHREVHRMLVLADHHAHRIVRQLRLTTPLSLEKPDHNTLLFQLLNPAGIERTEGLQPGLFPLQILEPLLVRLALAQDSPYRFDDFSGRPA